MKKVKKFIKNDLVCFIGKIEEYPYSVSLNTGAVGCVKATYKDAVSDKEALWGSYLIEFDSDKFEEHGCDSEEVWLYGEDLELVEK